MSLDEGHRKPMAVDTGHMQGGPHGGRCRGERISPSRKKVRRDVDVQRLTRLGMTIDFDINRVLKERQSTIDLLPIDASVEQFSQGEQILVLDGKMSRGHFISPSIRESPQTRPRKAHNAALVCLMRRRIDVLHSMLEHGTLYEVRSTPAAASRRPKGHPVTIRAARQARATIPPSPGRTRDGATSGQGRPCALASPHTDSPPDLSHS
ncbi:hypothetical protein WBG06_26370 [Nocardioides sp. CCNWLW239]|uniref:hypothetical protein n=1 Tax=Nocardioides sp. CCNWLW239 TaxID=3128902 RepID=UPI0030190B1D